MHKESHQQRTKQGVVKRISKDVILSIFFQIQNLQLNKPRCDMVPSGELQNGQFIEVSVKQSIQRAGQDALSAETFTSAEMHSATNYFINIFF